MGNTGTAPTWTIADAQRYADYLPCRLSEATRAQIAAAIAAGRADDLDDMLTALGH